tara:strand:- start:1867 stop:2097 length:231 start_codon:yes stop_codon:yes gene_type:complete
VVKVLIFIITLLIFLIIYFVTKKFSKKAAYLNLILVLLIFLGLVAFFLHNKIETKKIYYPPKFDGEVVIPGYFDEN